MYTHTHSQSHKIIRQNNSFSSNLRSVQVYFPCRRLYSASFSVAFMIYIYSAHPIHESVHQWDGTTKWCHSDSSTHLLDPTAVAYVLWRVCQRQWVGFCLSPYCHPERRYRGSLTGLDSPYSVWSWLALWGSTTLASLASKTGASHINASQQPCKSVRSFAWL